MRLKQWNIKNIYLKPNDIFYSYYKEYLNKKPNNCETDNKMLQLFKLNKKLPSIKKINIDNVIKYTDNEKCGGFRCPICFDTYKKKDIIISKCGHIQCLNCFLKVHSRTKTNNIECHMCRKKNDNNTFVNLSEYNEMDYQLKYINNSYGEIFKIFGIKFIEIIKYFYKNKRRFIGKNKIDKTNIIICDSYIVKDVILSCIFLDLFDFKIMVNMNKSIINKKKDKDVNNDIEQKVLINGETNIFIINNDFDYNYPTYGNLKGLNIYRFIVKDTIDEKIFNKEVILF